MAKVTDGDESLKRLGGGRWQTRDERFTIEPQSGTWVVVDAEQTDDLGLALVRGPFGSLGAAKEAIAAARGTELAESPLTARVAKLRDRPATSSTTAPKAKKPAADEAEAAEAPAKPRKAGTAVEPEPPSEPRWISALEPAERRRAKRLIDRLSEAGAADPEGIVRRDLVGEVPAVAAYAIAQALADLGADAPPQKVVRLLANGRDEGLEVRWRLVDGDDRPITIDADTARRR